jgi:methyl-accepting chemotaxis protein
MEEIMEPNTQSSPMKFKRKQIFISKEFQLRYAGIILGMMFLSAILCSYIVYYTMMVTMGEKLASVYPQGKLVAMLNTINLRLLFSLILISPIVVFIGIFLSHRIAGPIFRMERDLRSIAAGDLNINIVLRQKDELKTVAAGINYLTQSFKANVVAQKERLSRAHVHLEALRKIAQGPRPQDSADFSSAISKLDEVVKGLDSDIQGAVSIESNIAKLDTELLDLSKSLDKFKT